MVLSFHHHRTAAWLITVQQERQRHHQDSGKPKHVVHIDISQGLSLRLKLVVQLPPRQEQSVGIPRRHVQGVPQGIDPLLKDTTGLRGVLQKLILMPLRPLRYQGIGERNENAAPYIADEVDQSRYLIVFLRGNSKIRSRGDRDKDKRDGNNLHHAQLGGKTKANQQAKVARSVEISDRENNETQGNQVSRRKTAHRLASHGHCDQQSQPAPREGKAGNGRGIAKV